MVMKRDKTGTWRFVGQQKKKRESKIIARGLPVRVVFNRRSCGFVSITCTPIEAPPGTGFVHLSSHRQVRSCYRSGYYYHLTLALARCWKGKPDSFVHRMQGHLNRIQRHLSGGRNTRLQVRQVSRNSVAILQGLED